jgi:glucose/arabinose dehydrogenase
LWGKILRIDPRPSRSRAYRVPASNPFVGRAGARPEIWSYGLRNPWRFSFDLVTGALTIGDVAYNGAEEIDFAPPRTRRGAGANFGWNCFEGRQLTQFGACSPADAVPPVLEYFHSTDACSVVGGYVVRDRALPSLRGRYLYGDLCGGGLRSVRLAVPDATGDKATGMHVGNGLVSFGQDARRRIYAVSILGPVYRVQEAP